MSDLFLFISTLNFKRNIWDTVDETTELSIKIPQGYVTCLWRIVICVLKLPIITPLLFFSPNSINTLKLAEYFFFFVYFFWTLVWKCLSAQLLTCIFSWGDSREIMQAQRAPATFSHLAKQIIQMTPQVLTIDVLP